MLKCLSVGMVAIAVFVCPMPAAAQRPPAAVEFLAGWTGFIDEASIDHAVFGGAARLYLTPRISIGPEVSYMRGPNTDRDWFFLGNLTWDVRRPQAGRPPRVSPFLIAGGGFFIHSRFLAETFRTTEGAFAGGGGVRVRISPRVYAMGDFRMGWEPHFRATGGIGLAM